MLGSVRIGRAGLLSRALLLGTESGQGFRVLEETFGVLHFVLYTASPGVLDCLELLVAPPLLFDTRVFLLRPRQCITSSTSLACRQCAYYYFRASSHDFLRLVTRDFRTYIYAQTTCTLSQI